MKDCKKIHPFLSPYLDNLLSPREAGRVAAHLKDCSDARKELEDLKHLRDVLIALPEPKPPHDLHQRIMAKVQGHSLPVHASRPFWFLPAGALAVAAMVTVVVLVQNPDLMSFRNPKYNSLSPEQKNLVAANQPATQVADSLKAQSNRPAPNTQSYAPSQPQSFEPGLAKDVKTNSAPEAQPASMPQAKEKRAAKKAQKMEVAMDKVEPQAVEAPAGASAGIPSSDLTFGGSTTVGQPLEKENKQNLSNESAANLPSAQAPAAAPAVSNPTPITSWSGSFNPSTPESQELVTDAGTFQKYWQTFQPGQTPPSVDFTTQAVVVLMDQERPTAGYSIRISNLEEKPDQLVVHYKVETPAPGSFNAQVLTRPWALQIIPKPAKPVVFQKD